MFIYETLEKSTLRDDKNFSQEIIGLLSQQQLTDCYECRENLRDELLNYFPLALFHEKQKIAFLPYNATQFNSPRKLRVYSNQVELLRSCLNWKVVLIDREGPLDKTKIAEQFRTQTAGE